MNEYRYPFLPGFQNTDTSREAATAIAARAIILRARCLACICATESTADETAEELGESVLAVRPRITELKKSGLIEDTGARRLNRSGRRAAVYRARQNGKRGEEN